MSKHNMSYSQRKRERFDYKAAYFRRNPGLFGKIYFCAYCKRPLLRNQVQVDHIIPLASHLGINRGFNLVSACETCNKRKSSKKDIRILIGYSSKAVDSIMFATQNVFLRILYVIGNGISYILFRSPKIVRILVWLYIIGILLTCLGGIK